MRKLKWRTFRSGGEWSVARLSGEAKEQITGTTGAKTMRSAGIAGAAKSACREEDRAGSKEIRLHSFTGLVLAGFLHVPSFWQQRFSALGNMKNCGHEMHPPHSSVSTMRKESPRPLRARNIDPTSGYQRAPLYMSLGAFAPAELVAYDSSSFKCCLPGSIRWWRIRETRMSAPNWR